MSRTMSAVCGLIGLAALAVGAMGAAFPVLPKAPELDFAKLQRVAEAACRCDRAAKPGDEKGCWAELDRAIPPDPDSFAGTACAPVSEEQRCVGGGEETMLPDGIVGMTLPKCVTTGYSYVGSGGEVRLCSRAEAQAVERMYNKESAAAGDPNAPTPLADKLARDFAAGKPVANVDGPHGCTG